MVRKLFNKAFGFYLRHRYPRIRQFMEHPHKVQNALLQELLRKAAKTEWGQRFNYSSMRSGSDFRKWIPVQDYEHLKPMIDKMMHGHQDVLWPGKISFFSKSSGTTSDKSKFIPVSEENLLTCHIRGTRDTMTFFYHHRPDALQFEKKTLLMGGSIQAFDTQAGTTIGDVSAVMIHNMPAVARPFVTPDFETSLLSDFEEKIDRMVRISGKEDVVMIGGVPTWTVVLFRKMLAHFGKSSILEIWPNLQGYVHGGVSFTPYRQQFQDFLPSENITYQEIYNASEGYFAVQDDFESNDMLLLLDNGVYYEFLPMEEWHSENPRAIPLAEVETEKQYALVISTNAGLWRYMIGDTVTFTSTSPYRIRISGRTKQFINVFGEEVVVENTDKALATACQQTGAVAQEYTVAPVFFGNGKKGGHEWLIEFEKQPADLDSFETQLDKELQNLNSDYEAKRYHNMALTHLKVHPLAPDTFNTWMKARGKFGGQNKVPRLSNERKYVESILEFRKEESKN